MYILGMVKCGPSLEVDWMIPHLIGLLVTLIKIGVPILLIFFGMLDLGKAVMAQKEDEIKKSQGLFVKRIIAAALVFFVVMIVQTVFNLIGGSDKKQIWDCVDCFVNGPSMEEDATSSNAIDCRSKNRD